MLSITRDVGVEPHLAVRVPRPRVVHPRPEAWTRPAHPADIAQARLFDAVLLGEIAELEELAASMEKRWLRRCERGIDDISRPPENLARMRGRVAEAQQLLDALRDRFPTE
ncbi:hypothetical protein [Mycobacterium sp. ACS1612]|uniref:hypothetical protein n=1 Tax=Mycobacterium sp. ACS1612 TaxID=1834117 RepID=UPI000A88285A|nr:hypothetical protein [Mycobacterium sp. ACS1612]